MKIAIVGAEESKWKPEQKEKVKQEIHIHLSVADGPKWDRAVLVSGGCHRGGVDIWAEEIADEMGLEKEIFPAEVHQWLDEVKNVYADGQKGLEPVIGFAAETKMGYKSRNEKIAKTCNVLWNFEPKGNCRHCKGTGENLFARKLYPKEDPSPCTWCGGDGAYSGGTWTYNYAKRLRKEVHKVVIK